MSENMNYDAALKENTSPANTFDFDDDDPLGATSVSKKSLVIFFVIDTSCKYER